MGIMYVNGTYMNYPVNDNWEDYLKDNIFNNYLDKDNQMVTQLSITG